MVRTKIYLFLALIFFSIHLSGQQHCVDTIDGFGVRVCAKFNGDESGQKFAKFIEKTLKYPKVSKNDIMSGCVIARFLLDVNGNLFNIEIIESLREDYDNAVIEAMKQSPKWTPATINGKPIGQVAYFPVHFGKNRKDKSSDCGNAIQPIGINH
jgi:TonB family protein